MNEFTRSIKKVFFASMKSFKDFPATIAFALGFMLVIVVRIHMDWSEQESYDFLFNCLQWSFAFGVFFSLMLTTGAHSRFNTKQAFIGANIISGITTMIVFILLYFFSGRIPEYAVSANKVITSLAIGRVTVGMMVSYLIFMVLGAKTNNKEDFPTSLFMNLKAFFIALIYGLVIIAGVSGVAGAFQALLYQDMSSKVYMYIAAITGFVAFTIFVGYFPDFRKGASDEYREVAEKQPRFIELLFGYIMVPIMIALSVVLLLWTGRTIITSAKVPFANLSAIAASYTIIGIWLHMMVSGHDTKVARFYRRFYPIAALVILAFEASALINQLSKSSLKLTEYWFILVWILAVVGAVLLIVLKSKAYIVLVAITCILAIVSVLPFVGYNSLPVKAQANRLERLLIRENMLENNRILPASEDVSSEVKEAITDAAIYLEYAGDAKLPYWFDDGMTENQSFRSVFGFDKTWPKDGFEVETPEYTGIILHLPLVPIDISEYNLAIGIDQGFDYGQDFIKVDGLQGTYQIYLDSSYSRSIPSFEIKLNEKTIIQKDMSELINKVITNYPFTNIVSEIASIDDMTMVLETDEIKVLLVFRSLEIYDDSQNDGYYYEINIETVYISEKN